MLEHHKVTFELVDHRHLMALISVADTEQTVDQMTDALLALCEWAARERPNETVPLPHHRELGTELVMRPTDAFFAPTRKVKLEEAARSHRRDGLALPARHTPPHPGRARHGDDCRLPAQRQGRGDVRP